MAKTIVCRGCQKEFESSGGRGRPPVKCVDCRTAPKAKVEVNLKETEALVNS